MKTQGRADPCRMFTERSGPFMVSPVARSEVRARYEKGRPRRNRLVRPSLFRGTHRNVTAATGKPASLTNHKTRGGGVCWSPPERQGLPSFRLIPYVGGEASGLSAPLLRSFCVTASHEECSSTSRPFRSYGCRTHRFSSL